jgi:hypothetical protein
LAGISAPSQQQKPLNSATRVEVSAVGVLCGLAGVEHGVGEVLQGNIATTGIVINAWQPASPLFGVEPALTVVPNFLATGILAIIVSLIVTVWAVAFVQRKNGGVVFILLSIIQLFVGGGIAPLFPAIAAGVAATRINAPLTWWRAHLPVSVRDFLAKVWPFSLIAFSFLFSSLLLSRLVYGENLNLIWILGYSVLGLIFLTVFAGFAHDIQRRSGE